MSTCEYTFDSVVRIVIVSIVITLLLVGFFASVVWLYLCKRNAHKFDISYDPKSTELSIIKSNQPNNNAQSRFAFDNPYFKDDDEFMVTTNDKLNYKYNNEISDATILSNGAALQNDYNQNPNNQIMNHVFKNSKVASTKQVPVKKAWEDGDLYKKPEKISVDLIGRDFTGLGFNIRGDMRNGIFIRDVLSRGPANESKKIKSGDKLSSITISMNNMVYEDALTILSYASPYNVTINLERENKQESNQKTKKSNKLNRTLQSSNLRIHHPLYKTRSVDNLIQIGKYDNLNYGTSNQYNYRLDNKNIDFSPNRPGVINRLKKQLITYFSPNASSDEHVQQQRQISNETERNSMGPLSSIQNLFTKQNNNKYNWPDEYSGQDNLNAVVVGNNLAFKDDDEDDNFRKEYQLSQLKYQRSLHNSQYQQHQQTNSIQQFNSLQYDAQNEHQQPNAPHFRNANHQQTNLIKYHQQTVNDLSQVDSMQSINQLNPFVNVNLSNDFDQTNYNQYQNLNRNKKHDEMDYCKGNSTQTNDLNDLSLTSSSQFISVPLDDDKTNDSNQIDSQLNFTTAQVHATDDRSLDNQINCKINQNILEDFQSKSKDKPRASSMSDLPNESKSVSMNPAIVGDSNLNSVRTNYQSSTLERAISLDLGHQKNENETTNLKQSKSIFNKFTKEDQTKTKRLIKMKNQSSLQSPKTSSSLSDVNYEQRFKLSNEKVSQTSLNNSSLATSLTASLSNCKLNGNQSKSIRNSLSTNSTCSSPTSLPSASSDQEYKDESLAYMLKSSSEENQSILLNNKNDKKISEHLDRHHHLDEAEISKESILYVNDQYKTRSMIDDDKRSLNEKEESIDLFSNKEQAKKIISDVFTMSSIRSLHSDTIKSDQQLQSELFQLNNQIDNNKLIDQSDKTNTDKIGTKGSISNFKISSIKKEIPVRSNLINDTASKDLFSSSSSSSTNAMTNLLANKSKDLNDQSIDKENEMKSKDQYSRQNIDDDEIVELRNKVAKLKKEFSLRQKLIENQNQQNVSRSRKSSNASTLDQTNNSKTALTKDKLENISISKKQEPLDFESWVFTKD